MYLNFSSFSNRLLNEKTGGQHKTYIYTLWLLHRRWHSVSVLCRKTNISPPVTRPVCYKQSELIYFFLHCLTNKTRHQTTLNATTRKLNFKDYLTISWFISPHVSSVASYHTRTSVRLFIYHTLFYIGTFLKWDFICSIIRLGKNSSLLLTSPYLIAVLRTVLHVGTWLHFILFCSRWWLVFCYFSHCCGWEQHFPTWTITWCRLTRRYLVSFWSR
jgi:hypothetical protein